MNRTTVECLWLVHPAAFISTENDIGSRLARSLL